MKRTRIGIFKGLNSKLRRDLEICRQLRIPLLALAEKERADLVIEGMFMRIEDEGDTKR